MKRNAAIRIFALLSLAIILAGGFRVNMAPAEENSKLTIAYMADEIGRIEPCG
ncbi:MAG: hypothetical protein ACE5OP_04735 [Candidatus Glassbacteria bacterium]